MSATTSFLRFLWPSLGTAALLFEPSWALQAPPVANPPGQSLVWRDERGIPHIDASNEEDGWRTLGYETGRDRLFQAQAEIKEFQGRGAELSAATSSRTWAFGSTVST
jgi:acyl-homoserine lactone acylase PvdQ